MSEARIVNQDVSGVEMHGEDGGMRKVAGPAPHTPGPWTLLSDRIAAPCHEHRNCEKTIAWLTRQGVLQCSNDGRGQSPNARLIAAAPDLLAALKRAEAYTSLNIVTAPPQDTSFAVLEAIRAAIAKAEGRE